MATATIQIQPDEVALASPSDSSASGPADALTYVSGQVGVISGDAFAQSVARATGLPKATIAAQEVGTSPLVELTATGDTSQQALDRVSEAVREYRSSRTDAATSSLNQELTAVQGLLAHASSDAAQSLNERRANILVALARVPSMVPTVAEPTETSASGLSPRLEYAVLGVLAGLVLGGAVLTWLVRRPQFGALEKTSDVVALGGTPVYPVMGLQDPAVAAAVKLLVHRQDIGELGRRTALCLVGGAPEAGALLASALRGLPSLRLATIVSALQMLDAGDLDDIVLVNEVGVTRKVELASAIAEIRRRRGAACSPSVVSVTR